jgi:ribosome-binding protein aMBF1 (putative translation factor)
MTICSDVPTSQESNSTPKECYFDAVKNGQAMLAHFDRELAAHQNDFHLMWQRCVHDGQRQRISRDYANSIHHLIQQRDLLIKNLAALLPLKPVVIACNI